MKYVNQLEYPDLLYVTRTSMEGEAREKGKTSTIRSSGCGLCSAVMVADRLLPNCEFNLRDAIRISYDTDANYMPGTSLTRFGPAFAEKLGLIYEESSDPERVREYLRTGGAVIANTGGDRDGYIGVFSHGGHYIALVGEEPDGRIAVLDPSYKEGKYEEDGRAGKVEMKHGVLALCDMDVLVKDTANREPSFYLFRRK